jgi:pseudouridine synthase
MERVQKLLARAGVASRREGEKLILQGRVTVDGAPVALGDQADPDTQVICVDGRQLRFAQSHTYLMLNKPVGYVSTRRDPEGRRTVMDLIPADLRSRLYPVGRLDYDSEGLLLLTDDGELANALTHPRFEARKTYQALVSGNVGPRALSQLRHGLVLEDGPTAPAHARILSTTAETTQLEIGIHEGRKHQVKRMCLAIGHPVRQLARVAMGGVELGTLPPGKWRHLTTREVARLREFVTKPAPGADQ